MQPHTKHPHEVKAREKKKGGGGGSRDSEVRRGQLRERKRGEKTQVIVIIIKDVNDFKMYISFDKNMH